MVYNSKVTMLQEIVDDEIDELNEEDTELYLQLSITKRKETGKTVSERLLKLQQQRETQKKPVKVSVQEFIIL